MIRQALLMVAILTPCIGYGAIVLKGDDQAVSGETFSFKIQQYKVSNSPELVGANLYVAAYPTVGGAGNVKQFAVSRVLRETTQFVGLTPEKAKVNGSAEPIGNPLYDQGIAYMTLFNGQESNLAGAIERPVVVTNSDLKTIYFINNYTAAGSNVDIISVSNNSEFLQNIPDSTGAITSGVAGLCAAHPYLFPAVGSNGGSFGTTGSGIVIVLVGEFPTVNDSKFTGAVVVDASTGSPANPGGNRAAPIDVTLDSLKIGADLASIGTIVDLHWDVILKRLYIALEATGGAAGTDGARSILVGRVTESHQLFLYPIAPAAAFDSAGTQIIGNVGSTTSVSAHKVRTMYASTTLSYLIVQGDVGSPGATTRAVYALPLVTSSNAQLTGTIASKNADPVNVFVSTAIPLFTQRQFQTAATSALEMPRSTDTATLVGGGAMFDGDITDMMVYGDTVFVTVQNSDANEVPGIFSSQAIFQSNGAIKSWTKWKRAGGTTNNVQSVTLDPLTGQFSMLVANNGTDVKTVKRTEWSTGDISGFASAISSAAQYMPQEVGGVQGVFDFVATSTTMGTATPGLFDISVVVATGLHRVMLFQTSQVIAGGVIPTTGSGLGSLTQFNNGTIEQTLPIAGSNMIGIMGGALEDLGAITAAEIARDGAAGANGYLFVGGTGGLAVLSKADGTGWDATTGLSAGFTGITAGMSFKKIGNYTNVYKIINDGNYLYVLTNKQLDRIDLTAGNVGLGQLAFSTIATSESVPGVTLQGTFLDAIVSHDLLILATSIGLFKLDGSAQNAVLAGASWQHIDAPEAVGPMQQLFAITPTGRLQDATQGAGSYLIALSSYRGKNQAQLVRYAIDSSSVERIDDLFVKNIPSYFANFGQFRALTATDGSIYFGTRNQTEDMVSMVTALFSNGGVHTGSRYLSNKIIPVQEIASTIIAAIVQTSATGSWLVAGDGGIRANE